MFEDWLGILADEIHILLSRGNSIVITWRF